MKTQPSRLGTSHCKLAPMGTSDCEPAPMGTSYCELTPVGTSDCELVPTCLALPGQVMPHGNTLHNTNTKGCISVC